MNPTPKQVFMSNSSAVKAHSALLDRPEFKTSLEVALAHYTRMMCVLAPMSLDTPNQLQASAMCFQRIQGANELVSTLLGLHELPPKPAPRQTDNLHQ